jgi:hypothetical protein
VIIGQTFRRMVSVWGESILSVEIVVKLISMVLRLCGIAFFLYAAFQGVFGIGGSTSVFTGVGVLVLVILGTHVIDKFGQIR